ncbi:MAG TPA: hypothetical protein VHP33_05115 [Polyangiaceae bacterium]|nr:hypothetical protein [Polyangiaceae bacterium]
MKHLSTLALVATFAGSVLAACSSDPEGESDTNKGGSTSTAGSIATAGTTTTTAGSATGGTNTGTAGSGTSAGTSSGGANTAGSGTSGSGNGGAHAGSGGASGGASGGSGGSGGASNPNAVVTTCGAQMYTPSATPGAACVTKAVPATPLIAAFEDAGAAPGWGVYPNVDGMTGFTPATATPSGGGANGTTKALSYVVTNLTQGIKLQVGFGTQCQDVRTFEGLSFWAKGTIDAATVPFAVDANTIVIQVGSEKSLLGGCVGDGCAAAPPDKRITISADWKEYRIPFDCFGDGLVFDGYYTNILFSAFGTNSTFAIDQVGYY